MMMMKTIKVLKRRTLLLFLLFCIRAPFLNFLLFLFSPFFSDFLIFCAFDTLNSSLAFSLFFLFEQQRCWCVKKAARRSCLHSSFDNRRRPFYLSLIIHTHTQNRVVYSRIYREYSKNQKYYV